MRSMSSKERVLAAIHREEPDRVPVALWGSYYTLNDDTYFNMLKHFDLGEPVPPFRKLKPRNSNYYDDRLLDLLETDVRYIWCGFTDLGGARMDYDCRDAWGVKWQRSGPHITSIDPPLKGAGAEGIEAFVWPDPEKYLDFDLIKARLGYLESKYPDKAIGARAVNSYGPFEQASVMRGREDFYMDMIAEPEITRMIIRRCTDIIVRTQEIFLDRVGKHLDFFEIPGDDYGGMSDLLISPASFEELILPELARIVESVKDFRADLPVAFHSDGAIQKILGDLAGIGIDILNPMEPLEAMDWAAAKREFGDRMSFMGGVDLKTALPGSKDDVIADVKRCIDTFGKGGGYILTSANHMQGDIPPENIVTMFETAKTYGTYRV
jgi:uroporphyrinogen decarboxylase